MQKQPCETLLAQPAAAFTPETQSPVSTFTQFSARHPAFTTPSLRNLRFKAETRINANGETVPGNGLLEAGAILRIGRKVLIHEQRFFEWLDAQQRSQNEVRGKEPSHQKLQTRRNERRGA